MKKAAWRSKLFGVLAVFAFGIGIPAALAAVNVVINGTTYSIPQKNEKGWGDNVTAWIQAASSGLLQKSGGTFTLTNEVDFGATYGLVSPYFKSKSSNISTSGALRLSNTDTLGWRNAANGGNLLLGVNASDELTFNGNPLIGSSPLTGNSAVVTDADGMLVASATTDAEIAHVGGVTSALCGVDQSCTLTNKTIDAGDNTISDLADANIATGADIDRAKIDAGTAYRILANDSSGELSENAAITASRAVASDANGQLEASATTATELGYVSGVTSAIQTQIDAKLDDAAGAVANSNLANMTQGTIKGRASGAGTGAPVDLTSAQATAILDNVVGDSGSGGTKGLVPAPASGDAAANKFLKADGSWAVVPSTNTAPTVQRFTSGSGTYTTPANVLYITVEMVGGGGGGEGSGSTDGTAATAGGNTTFGTSLLTANGGGPGNGRGNGSGGAGGSTTVNSPAVTIAAVTGANGDGSTGTGNGTLFGMGSRGGSSPFGGAGGSTGGVGSASGRNASANSGSGGAGGSGSAVAGAASGAAGGYLKALISSPASTYSYAVGAAGAAGGAGTSGTAGGDGGSGVIIVTEYY